MILIDSSVWIDVLHRRETPQTAFFRSNLSTRRWATADLVLAEVLQGARSDEAADLACDRMGLAELIVVGGHDVAVAAARHYRRLRAMGITIRKTIDTLIATRCILDGIELLYADRDFDPFVQHFGLRPALQPTGLN